MEILVYEHLTGGGFAKAELPAWGLPEGYAMLKALIEDFKRLGCKVSTTLDWRIPSREIQADQVQPVKQNDRLEEKLVKLASKVDAAIIVAPEQGGTLLKRIELVEKVCPLTMNCPSAFLKTYQGKAEILEALRLRGVKIPETIIALTKEKEATALLDGDRGGDLILKELLQVANIKYVARAPPGKEVEELSPKEIMEALAQRVPVKELKAKRRVGRKVFVPHQIVEAVKELEGTWEAVLFNGNMERIARVPVAELVDELQHAKDVDTVVFDGVITQRLVDVASEKKIKCLVGARISDVVKKPLDIHILTFSDLE